MDHTYMKQLVKLSIIYVNEYVFYIYIHFRFIFDTIPQEQWVKFWFHTMQKYIQLIL